MIRIDIYKDFTTIPGARYYSDGPFSGEEFYDKWLKPKYVEAKDHNVKLIINLDGTEGYPSSFLSESFGRLGAEFGKDEVKKNIEIISDEIPKYKRMALEAVNEKK